MRMYDEIRLSPLKFPKDRAVSPLLAELMSRMLAKDPAAAHVAASDHVTPLGHAQRQSANGLPPGGPRSIESPAIKNFNLL